MTGPVWNGKGVDPWMPERLDARLEAARTEKDIRQIVWAELSGWLVETARAVLRGGQRPNPDAVWARVPAWREAVDLIVSGEIRKAMGLAFRKVMGASFRWDQRVNVTAYLAEVTNRLVRVPEEVFDLVAHQVATGVNLGEGIPELRRRIDTVLSTTGTARWSNRATVIARTETIGALNAGRAEAFRAAAEDEPDAVFERLWLATDDARTRDTHVVADGQRVPLGRPFIVGGFELAFPGDPSGPPQEVIQCVPGDTLVWLPSIRSVFRRWYEGEMVTIGLATGDQLTITPNHPVLRADGRWTPAGLLQEGDHLVHGLPGGQTTRQPDQDGGPTEIRKVYDAARLMTTPQRIPLSPPDLHGDHAHGEVEVVPVHGELTFHGEPASDEEIRQFGLTLADTARATEGTSLGHQVPNLPAWGEVDLGGTPGAVGGDQGGPSLLGRESCHADAVGFTSGPGVQAHLVQATEDDLATDVAVTGHLQDALPLVVGLAEIVKIDRHSFVGHVFNLDTGRGWYISQSIITRNCRCTMLLVEPGETVDMSNRQYRRGR